MATSKTDISIQDLVGMAQRGELRLPEMQRRYVWRASRVRDLLDSLYRGYPSGSILIWETEAPQPTRQLAVQQDNSPFTVHKLLLDGQQRITSLAAVLRGEPVAVRGRQKPIEILFNLEHPEGRIEFTEVEDDSGSDDDTEEREEEEESVSIQERLRNLTFVVASKSLAQQPNWISVTNVFKENDQQILTRAGIKSFDDSRYAKYTERLARLRSIKSYMYSVNILSRELSYEEVAEIFVRVNSLGVKLRGSDLALAQITARWPNSLKFFEEFQEECEDSYMTLDLGLLVRTMVVMATNQSKFLRVANTPTKDLQAGWEKAKAGLRFAVNFLRTNASIEDESLLSSPLFFIVIAYYSQIKGESISPKEVRDLVYWCYVASAKGRYSRGSTETLLDSDLRVIERGGGVQGMIDNLNQQFGRLNFETADFIGRGHNSPLFSLVFLALRASGATDWSTGIKISTLLQGRQHRIQYHHIFPKGVLKDQFERGSINEIANFAFISGRTNQRIGAKDPLAYLSSIVETNGEEVITKQGVPWEKELYKISNFPKFLERRRQILCEIVNNFVQKIRETGA
jgi:hypothetical protein